MRSGAIPAFRVRRLAGAGETPVEIDGGLWYSYDNIIFSGEYNKVRKFNKKMTVFVFAVIFLITGICNKGFFDSVAKSAKKLNDDDNGISLKTVRQFCDEMETNTQEKLVYHNELMDINSLKENISGTRIITKDDSVIVRSDNGSLIAASPRIMDESSLDEIADHVKGFEECAQGAGAKFLYCAVPTKTFYETYPENVTDNSVLNYRNYIQKLKDRQIPLLDLGDVFKEKNMSEDSLYFYTDHHWTSRTAFEASGAICERLNLNYGFSYDEKAADINNYKIKTYKNTSLGSYGKKVGTWFTWRGKDDFDLIIPEFSTDLTERSLRTKKIVRSGSFENTVLHTEQIKDDPYKSVMYDIYSNGNQNMQIVLNNLKEDGKTVLIIRDSFGSPVTPFLSLHTGQLHILDIRPGDRLNPKTYIRKIKPDYVIILYTGITSYEEGGKFDFDSGKTEWTKLL